MSSVLIVSSAENSTHYLFNFLNSHAFEKIDTVETGGKARRTLLEADYDLVVINAPLKDEFGHELAVDLVATTTAGVLILVKSELVDSVSRRVEEAGVIVVAKPVNRALLYEALRLSAATNRRLFALQSENSRFKRKVNELRLVGRAKCVLVQYRHLTESEAHRFIEKQAMDQRLSLQDIAEDILKTYEDI